MPKHKSEEIKKLIVEAIQRGETQREVPARFHVIQGLVESMPRRMKAVIKSKGYPTKY